MLLNHVYFYVNVRTVCVYMSPSMAMHDSGLLVRRTDRGCEPVKHWKQQGKQERSVPQGLSHLSQFTEFACESVLARSACIGWRKSYASSNYKTHDICKILGLSPARLCNQVPACAHSTRNAISLK